MKNKIKNVIKSQVSKIKNNKWYLIILVLFFIISILLNKPFKNENNVYTISDDVKSVKGFSIRLTEDIVISQRFIARDNNLRRIGVLVGTYDKTIKNPEIKAKVTDLSTQEVIFEGKLDVDKLEDNSYIFINFANQENSKGKVYDVQLIGLDNKNEFSFWLNSSENEYLGYNENGKADDSSKLVVASTYLNKKIGYVNFITWTLIFMVSAFFVINLLQDTADEKQFKKLVISLGAFFICCTPIFHKLDESDHFFRAYMISQGNFYDQRDEEGNIGGYISKSYSKILGEGDATRERLSLKSIVAEFENCFSKFSNDKEFYKNMYFCTTIPSGHLVPAFGIFVARILCFGIMPMVYFGRAMTYVFYSVLAYYAIKNMKKYKTLTFLIATMPIELWLAGSISLDPILCGATLLFTSICLKYFFESDNEKLKVSNKDIALMIFCGILFLTNKFFAYTPLLLLFFLIPFKKFSSKKQYITLISVAVILGIICLFLQYKSMNMFSDSQEDRNGNVNASEQIAFIMHNKIYTLATLVQTMQDQIRVYMNTFSYESSIPIVGRTVGTLVCLSAILEKSKHRMKEKNDKIKFYIVMLSTFTIFFTLSLMALYITYTPVGYNYIQGYQMRYLVPILPMLLIPIANCFDVENKIKNYEKKMIFLMFIANIDIILGEVMCSFSVLM